jgi:hypothetical protein
MTNSIAVRKTKTQYVITVVLPDGRTQVARYALDRYFSAAMHVRGWVKAGYEITAGRDLIDGMIEHWNKNITHPW